MELIGPDLHTREGQRAINADDGTSTDRRIATSRERLNATTRIVPRHVGHARGSTSKNCCRSAAHRRDASVGANRGAGTIAGGAPASAGSA